MAPRLVKQLHQSREDVERIRDGKQVVEPTENTPLATYFLLLLLLHPLHLIKIPSYPFFSITLYLPHHPSP